MIGDAAAQADDRPADTALLLEAKRRLCAIVRPADLDAAPRLEFAPGLSLRGLSPPLRLADFRLIAFDMDSTLINIECVDEIAAAAGRKAEVAAITEAAMRGEIADYKESLRRRSCPTPTAATCINA